jgi:hypothetical protein
MILHASATLHLLVRISPFADGGVENFVSIFYGWAARDARDGISPANFFLDVSDAA